jgi:lipoic acid synthetase
MPEWLARPIATPGRSASVNATLDELRLSTVCRSAKCPNRGECFASGTATFLVMGDACTRGCRFCAVDTRVPGPLDTGEPARLAEAAARMGLTHVVVTSVTRDDLPDGGAGHFVAVIEALRAAVPGASVEVLVPDFAGDLDAVDAIADAAPDVFNHNLETVPRLYAGVRPGASYERSLAVLDRAKRRRRETPTKSGLMVGLGETPDEVEAVMADLRAAEVDLLTLGQYLRPSREHLAVTEFVEPAVFARYEATGARLGFAAVASSPFVRSSYRAGELRRSAAAAAVAPRVDEA